MIFYNCVYKITPNSERLPGGKKYCFKSEFEFEPGEIVAIPSKRLGLTMVTIIEEVEKPDEFTEDELSEILYEVELIELDEDELPF